MVLGEAEEKRLEANRVSLEQARAGTHSRIVTEEKRLRLQQTEKLAAAEKLRDFRLSMVQVCMGAALASLPPKRASLQSSLAWL